MGQCLLRHNLLLLDANTAQTARALQRQAVGAGTSNTISASAARRNTQRGAGLSPSDASSGAVRDVRTGAATGGNPAYRGRVTGGTGTQPLVEDDSVIIPSEEEGEVEYESSFGAHVSDGSGYSFYAPASTGGEGMRRNTVRDIFEQTQCMIISMMNIMNMERSITNEKS